MRIIFILLSLLFVNLVFGQNEKIDSVIRSIKPTNPACILKRPVRTEIKNNCLNPVNEFLSVSDSLFHFGVGEIAGVYKIDDFYYCVSVKEGTMFYTYAGFRNVVVKKGQLISPGSLLGVLNPGEDCGDYCYDFIMTDGTKKAYCLNEVLYYLGTKNIILHPRQSYLISNPF